MRPFIQGGVYLARLDPAKAAEVGKIRPVVVLTNQIILDVKPPIILICPLSSQSKPEFKPLHIELPNRGKLIKTSYALVEHARAISAQHLVEPNIAQLTTDEITAITEKLSQMIAVV